MPDRATYLSRTLLSRIRNLEASRSESADPEGPTMMASAERVVSKVLAVEEGITDGATVQLVASALPRVSAQLPTSDRDVNEFADFLRKHLRL